MGVGVVSRLGVGVYLSGVGVQGGVYLSAVGKSSAPSTSRAFHPMTDTPLKMALITRLCAFVFSSQMKKTLTAESSMLTTAGGRGEVRGGRTDGRTDRQTDSSMLTTVGGRGEVMDRRMGGRTGRWSCGRAGGG